MKISVIFKIEKISIRILLYFLRFSQQRYENKQLEINDYTLIYIVIRSLSVIRYSIHNIQTTKNK